MRIQHFGLWFALVLGAASAPLVRAQEALEPAELARLERLSAIARALQAPEANGPELATEAIRLCGFALWDEDRKVLAEPSGAPRLGLAITDAEIRAYALMFREGQTVALEDLIAGLDVLYRGLGADGSIRGFVEEWIRDGEISGHASVRALTVFLHELGAARNPAAPLAATKQCELDPLQALLMIRVLSEDLGTPLRRAIARGEIAPGEERSEEKKDKEDAEEIEEQLRAPALSELAGRAESSPVEMPRANTAFETAPGWAEDAYVGGITGLFGEVVSQLGRTGRSLSRAASRANAISTIAKFIATYTFLRGEMEVESPGQPLVRTKTTYAGEERTLIARFWIDGSRVTDWLKENRQLAALAGLDLDMPRTGALKEVETAWDFEQDRRSSARQLVQVVEGEGDISRKRTDQNGEARLRVEGKPQPHALDPNAVLPLEKSLRVTVVPQVKATEIQQDLVDAVTGAIGIQSGGVGFLTPVIECLYRLKWKGGRWMTLHVRDWQAAESIGQLEVSISASGSTFSPSSAWRMTIQRQLSLTDVHLRAMGGAPPPPVDPKVLRRASPQVRAQIEAGMRAMQEAAMHPLFFSRGIGNQELHIHDSSSSQAPALGCGTGVSMMRSATTWDADDVIQETVESLPPKIPYQAEVDLVNKTVKLRFGAGAMAQIVTVSNGDPARREHRQEMSIFSGLELDPPFHREIVIPLQETPIQGMEASNYHGSATIRFTFGSGYRGAAILAYSITRKRL